MYKNEENLRFILERTIPKDFSTFSNSSNIVKSILFNFARNNDYEMVCSCLKDGIKVEKFESNDSWIMLLSIAKFDINNPVHFPFDEDGDSMIEEEGTPTHVIRLVTRSQWDMSDIEFGEIQSVEGYTDENGEHQTVVKTADGNEVFHKTEPLDLVDGDQMYIRYNENTGLCESIWEETWNGSQPDYYGGPIGGAVIWASELAPIEYFCEGNPFNSNFTYELDLNVKQYYGDDRPKKWHTIDELVYIEMNSSIRYVDQYCITCGSEVPTDKELIDIDENGEVIKCKNCEE
jgi:DNA-directed RNA polymerase subunit RPC12/RpoP